MQNFCFSKKQSGLQVFLTFAFLLLVFSVQAQNFFPASDTMFKYQGRSAKYTGTNATLQGGRDFGWSGTSVLAKFTGTSVKVRMVDKAGATGGGNAFYAVIDSNFANPIFHQGNNLSTMEVWTVSTSLSPGVHTIQVFKLTGVFNTINTFLGLELAPGATLLPINKPTRKIQFYGDSITEGANQSGSGQSESCNGYYTFGSQTGRILKADYSSVSFSGIGIVRGYASPRLLQGTFNRTMPWGAYPRWDFASWEPHIVVLNIGQNDKWTLPDTTTDKVMIPAYIAMLDSLRRNHPRSNIIASLGAMDATEKTSRFPGYVRAAVDSLRDPRISFYFFKYIGGPGHPSVSQAKTMADSLVAFIGRMPLAWELGTPTSNQIPMVRIATPDSAAKFVPTQNVTIKVAAKDLNGNNTISKVELFQKIGNTWTLIQTKTQFPHHFNLGNLSIGTYQYQAKATDDQGGEGFSQVVGYTVVANLPPFALVQAPFFKATFPKGDTVKFRIQVSDPNGLSDISKVEIFNKTGNSSKLLYTFPPNSGPLYIWKTDTLSVKDYLFTVKVTDLANATFYTTQVILYVIPRVSTLNNPNNLNFGNVNSNVFSAIKNSAINTYNLTAPLRAYPRSGTYVSTTTNGTYITFPDSLLLPNTGAPNIFIKVKAIPTGIFKDTLKFKSLGAYTPSIPIVATILATSSPLISPAVGSLSFTSLIASSSVPQSYQVVSSNLTKPIKIQALANFSLSLQQNGTYVQAPDTLTLPATGGSVWVKYQPSIGQDSISDTLVHRSGTLLAKVAVFGKILTVQASSSKSILNFSTVVSVPSNSEGYRLNTINNSDSIKVKPPVYFDIRVAGSVNFISFPNELKISPSGDSLEVRFSPTVSTPILVSDSVFHQSGQFEKYVRLSASVLTSVNEVVKGISIRVYPNPASKGQKINIESDQKLEEISFYDVLGKRKEVSISSNPNGFQLEGNLPDGIYNVHLKGNKTSKVLKLSIQ